MLNVDRCWFEILISLAHSGLDRTERLNLGTAEFVAGHPNLGDRDPPPPPKRH